MSKLYAKLIWKDELSSTIIVRLFFAVFGTFALGKLSESKTPPYLPTTLFQHLSKEFPNLTVVVVVSEGLIAISMLFRVTSIASMCVAILLLSTMNGILVYDLVQPHPLPCGCSGVMVVEAAKKNIRSIKTGILWGILRNLFLIFFSLVPIAQHLQLNRPILSTDL